MTTILPLIVMAVIALACVAGILCVAFAQGRTIHKLGNQLTANSDHQLDRIRVEEYREQPPLDGHAPMVNGTLQHDIPDVTMPDRWTPPR